MKTKITAVLCLSLLLQACSSSQVVKVLDEIQTSTDVAATIVYSVCAFGGIGPIEAAVCAVAPAYLTSAATATGTCANEVASADTNAMKYSTCVGAYAQAVVPNLPAGTNPVIASALSSVGALIKTVLDLLKPGTASANAILKMKIPGMLERHHLHSIAARANATVALLKTVK